MPDDHAPPSPPPPGSGATAAVPPRPWYRNKRYVIPLVVLVLFVLIGVTGEPPDSEEMAAEPAATTTPTPTPTPTSETVADGVPADAQRATVVNVTDGDTINVQPQSDGPLAMNAAHTIRLLLVDTPETVHPSQPVACYGPEASDLVTDRLLGETVWLEADVEDTDRYGRFLRHVWLDDGTNFNLELVEHGYADAVLYETNDQYWQEFAAAAETARAENVGLWSACESFGVPLAAGETGPNQRDGTAEEPASGPNCDPAYPTVCIPPPPPDLDCGQITDRRFEVLSPDPHRFDGNSDGLGCEG